MHTSTIPVRDHFVTMTPEGDRWIATIDEHLPVMERDFDLRSTYCAYDWVVAFNAAISDILGLTEIVG